MSYTLVQSMLLTLGVPLFINSLTRVEGAGWAYEAYMYTAKEPPLPHPPPGSWQAADNWLIGPGTNTSTGDQLQ